MQRRIVLSVAASPRTAGIHMERAATCMVGLPRRDEDLVGSGVSGGTAQGDDKVSTLHSLSLHGRSTVRSSDSGLKVFTPACRQRFYLQRTPHEIDVRSIPYK